MKPTATCSMCANSITNEPDANIAGNAETCFPDPTNSNNDPGKYHAFCSKCADGVGEILRICCPKCHPDYFMSLREYKLIFPNERWTASSDHLAVWAALMKVKAEAENDGSKFFPITITNYYPASTILKD